MTRERASESNCFAGLCADIFVSGPRLIAVFGACVCGAFFFPRREVSDLCAKVKSGLRWVKRSTLREGDLGMPMDPMLFRSLFSTSAYD